MTFTSLLPKPLRRYLLQREIRRYEKARDGAYRVVRWLTEHHAAFCRCASCEHRREYEAGKFTTKVAFEKELRELGLSI